MCLNKESANLKQSVKIKSSCSDYVLLSFQQAFHGEGCNCLILYKQVSDY